MQRSYSRIEYIINGHFQAEVLWRCFVVVIGHPPDTLLDSARPCLTLAHPLLILAHPRSPTAHPRSPSLTHCSPSLTLAHPRSPSLTRCSPTAHPRSPTAHPLLALAYPLLTLAPSLRTKTHPALFTQKSRSIPFRKTVRLCSRIAWQPLSRR